jgi:hypothetical protein
MTPEKNLAKNSATYAQGMGKFVLHGCACNQNDIYNT